MGFPSSALDAYLCLVFQACWQVKSRGSIQGIIHLYIVCPFQNICSCHAELFHENTGEPPPGTPGLGSEPAQSCSVHTRVPI